MKNLPATALTFVLAVCVFAGLNLQATAQSSPSDAPRKPVLVELFTSEGCSTCPPADALLQQLEVRQPIAGIEIIPMEEHVDYWNHDGWVDPFSSPEWTQRQQTYVSLIKKDVYTPEMVIDGQRQFVGNNAQQAEIELERAASDVKTDVTIDQVSREDKGARLNVSVGKIAGSSDGDAAEVWLAVTEDGLHSSVSRGENAGHELSHVATLRYLRKIGVAQAFGGDSFGAMPFVKFNSRWNVENLHVTVFVQKKKSRQILGAASIKIKG